MAERVTAYLAGVQDRLRAAELARAAESARAEEADRREATAPSGARRRFQVGLAASLLVLTTAGGLSFTYLAPAAPAARRAVRPGARRGDGAARQGPPRRRATRPPGATPWRRWSGPRARGRPTRSRPCAARSRPGLDEAERDARLRQALVDIRANQEDVGPDGTDAAYATAFRAAGLDLDALEPAEFARRLRRRREAVAIELSAFLDDWSAVRRAAKRPVAAWRKPLEAARLADPDPYRDRLRDDPPGRGPPAARPRR